MKRVVFLSLMLFQFFAFNYAFGASLHECYLCFLTKTWNTAVKSGYTIDEYMELIKCFDGQEDVFCDYHNGLVTSEVYLELVDLLSAEIILTRRYSELPLCLTKLVREIVDPPLFVGQYGSFLIFFAGVIGVTLKLFGVDVFCGSHEAGLNCISSRGVGPAVLILAVMAKLAHSGFKYVRDVPVWKEAHCLALKKKLEEIIHFEWEQRRKLD